MKEELEKFDKFKQNLDVFSGYLSGDADIKYYDSGKCKTVFSIPLKLLKEDSPIWLNCECWGRLAEKCAELKKGDEVLAFGCFRESEYKNKEGETKAKTVFLVKGIM